ncbi:2424_t:CDS:2, partial [Funneliformis caledonium]
SPSERQSSNLYREVEHDIFNETDNEKGDVWYSHKIISEMGLLIALIVTSEVYIVDYNEDRSVYATPCSNSPMDDNPEGEPRPKRRALAKTDDKSCTSSGTNDDSRYHKYSKDILYTSDEFDEHDESDESDDECETFKR